MSSTGGWEASPGTGDSPHAVASRATAMMERSSTFMKSSLLIETRGNIPLREGVLTGVEGITDTSKHMVCIFHPTGKGCAVESGHVLRRQNPWNEKVRDKGTPETHQ
jgi:hypothetical protein